MYHLKPIISSDIQIELPTSMYKLKPISTDRLNDSLSINLNVVGNKLADVSEISSKKPSLDIVQQINNILKQSKGMDMQELEVRQEVILKQLKELKERLTSMHKELKICSKPAHSKPQTVQARTASKPIDASNLRDVVINANPNNVPFSLVILNKLWTDRLSINLQFYTHSSVSSLSQSATNFQNICTAYKPTSTTTATLNVSFIWKSVDRIELINGPLPIVGESNILRYFSRIGPNEFNYETNGSNSNEIDSQLEMGELLLAAPTAKDRQIILKNLNATLGRNEYFGGTEPQLSDLCLASVVLQSTAEKELQPTLLKWSRKVLG